MLAIHVKFTLHAYTAYVRFVLRRHDALREVPGGNPADHAPAVLGFGLGGHVGYL